MPTPITIQPGDRFGKLLVLALNPKRGHSRSKRWDCICDCGNAATVWAISLRNGARSCGCYRLEVITTHGQSGTPEYDSWRDMRRRCLDPESQYYGNYGGRGITICPEWADFLVFLNDVGKRPGVGYTLERRDNNGNYGPDNCYWATRAEQARNKRNNVWLTFRGRTMVITDWASETGIGDGTLRWRYRRGWTDERILTTPVRKKQVHAAKAFSIDSTSGSVTFCPLI